MKNPNYLFALLFLALVSCSKDDDSDMPQIPDRIEIYEITVNSFPVTASGGSSWDVFDGADIYPRLAIGSTELINLRNDFREDATNSQTWQVNGVFLENPSGTYSIALFDKDDFGADEYMGGIDFIPWSENTGTPSTINLSCSGCNTSWQLKVDYQF